MSCGDVAPGQAESELQAIYDGMVDGLVLADIETKRVLRVNPAVCRMFGYPPEEMQRLSVSDLHPADEVPAVFANFDRLFQQPIARVVNRRCLRRDGTEFLAEINSSRLRYQGRHCAIGFFRDVTEARNTEEALARSEDALHKEQELLRHLLELAERDRELVAFELHDGFAQQLAGAKMQFESAARLQETNPQQARQAFDKGLQLLREGIQEARRLVSGLHPPVLEAFGVVPAIEHLVLEHQSPDGPQIEFAAEARFERLARPLENALFRIVQESLTNAQKHSRSAKIRVELSDDGQKVYLAVRDWGVGFDSEKVVEGHFGLRGIRQRARLFHGEAAIESEPGKGTTIRVELPLVPRAAEETVSL